MLSDDMAAKEVFDAKNRHAILFHVYFVGRTNSEVSFPRQNFVILNSSSTEDTMEWNR